MIFNLIKLLFFLTNTQVYTVFEAYDMHLSTLHIQTISFCFFSSLFMFNHYHFLEIYKKNLNSMFLYQLNPLA